MIPNYSDSTLPTVPGDWDPFVFRYTTDNGTCGYDTWATTTTTVTIYPGNTGANIELEPEPLIDLKAWKKALSRQAIWEAQVALRRCQDDPSPRVPLQARRGLSGRQAVRKRVCSGSSRYRVLVN